MWWPKPKQFFWWILVLVPKKIIESVLVVIAVTYVVLVFDIYVNTDKLSKINNSLNIFCQNITKNPNFTKGPVVFRVDRGTLIYRLNPYVSTDGLSGYTPFFLFPHYRTIILTEEAFKKDNLDVIVAHECGHIQGGLKHLGSVKEMEQYANEFATKILKTLIR